MRPGFLPGPSPLKKAKQGMEAGKESTESAATRFLALWARQHQGLCTDQELGELFGLLRTHLLKTSAVRALSAHERDDVLMAYLHEKLLRVEGAFRAPVNLYEFAAYIKNFVEDWRRKQPPPKPMPPEEILELLDGEVHSAGSTCSLDEFAGRSAAANQTTSAQRWIDALMPEERSLLLSVFCLGETATTTLEKLGMLGATHRIKKLGLILTNAHADGHWSKSSWFKHTKLGQLFKSLDINGDRDMLADGRQVLSLLCRLLDVDR